MDVEEKRDVKPLTRKEYADGPRLLADIGATNARFALERAPGRTEAGRRARVASSV